MKVDKLTTFMRKVLPLQYCTAVIVAAGNASRMEGIDKVMAPLGGEPMIVRTVRTFQESQVIREIVIVTREDQREEVSKLCRNFSKVASVVTGGADRRESVESGIKAVSDKTKLVAIHDGARPLVTQMVIDRTVRAAHSYRAAVPVVPVKDTIKSVKGGLVDKTPDRDTLRAVQTPQVFDLDLLRAALQKTMDDGITITDDCSAVEYLKMGVKIVDGDERNLKVTTPLDLKIANMILEEM